MNERLRSKGWWQTVPGVLTATASIITAVTGLIVALHQAGIFGGEEQKIPQIHSDAIKRPAATEGSVAPPPGPPEPSSSSQPDSYPVTVSGRTEVKIGDLVYSVLAARLNRNAPNRLSLRFEVRMTNTGRYPANFWAASFRLLIDGVPRAPENDLNELVDAHSAKEGILEFVIPDTTTDVGLQMGKVGDGAPTFPVALKSTKP